jgi:hypothetical protein
MVQVKLKGRIESLYKVRTVFAFAFIITFLTSNQYIKFYRIPDVSARFVVFFSQTSLLGVYASLIGLLLAAYAVLITMIPNFSSDSLKQPIFGQVNRLFLYTILNGIILMVIDFTNGIIPDNSIPLFLDIEIFFFISLLSGLIFCVLALSDLFGIVRRRGER